MNPLTQQGIVALKAGNKAEARRCFKLALQQDEKDISAWLWLSGAVEQERERIYCLKTVLRLDPQNALAQRGLAALAAQKPSAAAPAPGPFVSSTTAPPPATGSSAPFISTPPAQKPPAPGPFASSTTMPLAAAAPAASQPAGDDQPFTFASILGQAATPPAPRSSASSTTMPPPAPKSSASSTSMPPPAPKSSASSTTMPPTASQKPSAPATQAMPDLPAVPLFVDDFWADEPSAAPASPDSQAPRWQSVQTPPFTPEPAWQAPTAAASSTTVPPAQGSSAASTTMPPAKSASDVKAAPGPAVAKPAAKAPAGSKKPAQQQPRRANKPWLWLALGGMLLLLLVVVAGIVWMLSSPPAAGQAGAVAGLQATIDLRAGATDFPTPTPSFTPTPRPTRTPTATATFMVLGPTIVGQMQDIQREVSDLRGLPLPDSEVPSYVVTKREAESLLRNLYVNDATRTELENTKRGLVIFGMLKPTYDLVNLSLNHLVDNIGGFYLPDSKRIFVLAVYRFGGIEHFVYSHEFDHAVVDKAYNISQMQQCPGDSQRCAAMDALIEGDASLLMRQWAMQYATPLDYRDFLAYKPPAFALNEDLPEEFAPDALVLDSNFPYNQGLTFVSELYKRGNWAEVNRAYANPPASTEQILHPEKYLAGEGPALMDVPQIESVLGSDWQVIDNNSLGEWYTYLILGYGADKAAQIDDATAQKAAAGWGGDHYQIYYNAAQDQTAMAAHWVWDGESDAQEFDAALKKVLNERFRGNNLDQPGAACWQVNGQATCLVTRGSQSLWLSAPSMDLVNTMWAQYPELQ